MSYASLGQIQVFTGEGKGKSIAALGLALRLAGEGKRVAMIYFDKSSVLENERVILDKFDSIDYHILELEMRLQGDRTCKFGNDIYPQDFRHAREGLVLAQELIDSAKYDVLILDEFNILAALGAMPQDEVMSFLRRKPAYIHLILTGPCCPQFILDFADLATEFISLK